MFRNEIGLDNVVWGFYLEEELIFMEYEQLDVVVNGIDMILVNENDMLELYFCEKFYILIDEC